MSIASFVAVDQGLAMRVDALAGRFPHFDRLIELLSQNDLKDAFFVAMFWWLWFMRRTDPNRTRLAREHLLSLMCAGSIAVIAARILALSLPFRVRPRFEPALHFVVPAGTPSDMVSWSSFPSDHAALFGAFAIGIFYISRRVGIVALLYSLLVICMPRIYLGLHYPSDIAAGLLMGAVVVIAMDRLGIRHFLGTRLLAWEQAYPGAFYTGLFLVSYEYATMFGGVLALGSALAHRAL
jgi:undecaprenyl-diphosphatase